MASGDDRATSLKLAVLVAVSLLVFLVLRAEDDVFRLESYRLTQRGPSFPISEISFERRTRRFEARTQETRSADVKEASGDLEMPIDLYNGMALTLLKNLPPASSPR